MIQMKVLTSDNLLFEFDESRSRILMDLREDDTPCLPIHSDTLTRLQSGIHEESWEILVAMLRAADFLYMPEMLDRLGKHMAEILRGKNAKEVREMMSLVH